MSQDYEIINKVEYTEDGMILDLGSGKRVTLPSGQGVSTDEEGISTVDLNKLPPTPKDKP